MENKFIKIEKNKYYIPQIEELLTHVISEKFILVKVDKPEGLAILNFNEKYFINDLLQFFNISDYSRREGYSINPTLYMIKYLDSEDIKALGFEEDIERNVGNRVCFVFESDYSLSYYIGNNRCRIVKHNPPTCKGLDEIIFDGIIKNKSELKILLKQLNIIKKEEL